jgi:hypothetical protein
MTDPISDLIAHLRKLDEQAQGRGDPARDPKRDTSGDHGRTPAREESTFFVGPFGND